MITSKDLACSHLDQIILKIKWINKGLDNAIVHLPWLSYQVAFCYSTNKNIRSLWVSTATSNAIIYRILKEKPGCPFLKALAAHGLALDLSSLWTNAHEGKRNMKIPWFPSSARNTRNYDQQISTNPTLHGPICKSTRPNYMAILSMSERINESQQPKRYVHSIIENVKCWHVH